MENIEKIIKDLTDRIVTLEKQLTINTQKPTVQKQSSGLKKERDKTKYMFEGSVYSKNQLVLAVVSSYVKKHNDLSFLELSKVFDKSLQGSLGVVELYDKAKQKSDAKKRYYMSNALLLNNQKVVVCTQWGAFNIYKFILRAKELGFSIIEVKN